MFPVKHYLSMLPAPASHFDREKRRLPEFLNIQADVSTSLNEDVSNFLFLLFLGTYTPSKKYIYDTYDIIIHYDACVRPNWAATTVEQQLH